MASAGDEPQPSGLPARRPAGTKHRKTQYPERHQGKNTLALDGRSLWSLWQGKESFRRDTLFLEHLDPAAVRINPYKMVRYAQDEDWELYNIPEDRGEMNDLSDSLPVLMNQLQQSYRYWANKVGVVHRDSAYKYILKPKPQ